MFTHTHKKKRGGGGGNILVEDLFALLDRVRAKICLCLSRKPNDLIGLTLG